MKIDDRLGRLCNKMRAAGCKQLIIDQVQKLVCELEQGAVHCIDRFIKKLEDTIDSGDMQNYYDILIEGRFALTLARFNFSEIEIEYSKRGPDLKANWNKRTIYYEVRRRRAKEQDKELKRIDDVTWEWEKTKPIHNIMVCKQKQLKEGELNILVIWSDSIGLGKPLIQEVLKKVDQTQFKDMSGILITEGGGGFDIPRRDFEFIRYSNASLQVPRRLATKLETLRYDDPEPIIIDFS